MKSGSILFCHKKGILNLGKRVLSKNKIQHVALYFEHEESKYVIERRGDDKVTLRGIEEFKIDYKFTSSSDFLKNQRSLAVCFVGDLPKSKGVFIENDWLLDEEMILIVLGLGPKRMTPENIFKYCVNNSL